MENSDSNIGNPVYAAEIADMNDRLAHPLNDETKVSIMMYRNNGFIENDFIRAVLENDLTGAISNADVYQRRHIFEIFNYCASVLPMSAWGSRECVDNWVLGAA